jgi:hypothetical protein
MNKLAPHIKLVSFWLSVIAVPYFVGTLLIDIKDIEENIYTAHFCVWLIGSIGTLLSIGIIYVFKTIYDSLND